MGKKKSNRGPEPTELTVRILCSRAAGMCQFCGCDKRLFYDTVTLADFNNSYVAHIIASSPDGPRGSIELSHRLSDDVANLMLMCGDHHTLIDKDVETYTVDKLTVMKIEHESNISELCSYFNVPKTELLFFSSPIKGNDIVINTKVAALDGLLNLTGKDFFNSLIILPSLQEQQKIAAILTTCDKIIELKEKLIAEKQRQKKWLMQNLLTGKKRMVEFNGEWKTIKLGSVFLERIENNCVGLELIAITGNKGGYHDLIWILKIILAEINQNT